MTKKVDDTIEDRLSLKDLNFLKAQSQKVAASFSMQPVLYLSACFRIVSCEMEYLAIGML